MKQAVIANLRVYLGMSIAFLERDRWAGAKIPFVRVGSRTERQWLDYKLMGSSPVNKAHELQRNSERNIRIELLGLCFCRNMFLEH